MARWASTSPIPYVVPFTATGYGHDVVSVVGLIDLSAVNARERITCQHGLTPPPVCLVAVPTRRRIGPPRLIPALRRTQTQWPVRWYPLGHGPSS